MWDDVVHTSAINGSFCNEACVNAWLARTSHARGNVMNLPTLWRLAQGGTPGGSTPGARAESRPRPRPTSGRSASRGRSGGSEYTPDVAIAVSVLDLLAESGRHRPTVPDRRVVGGEVSGR